MVQWVNRLQNNIFVNPPPLPLSCEISGALNLTQLGLTAGWLAGWQAGWLAGRLAAWLAGRLAAWLAGRQRNTGKFRNFQNWL